MRTITTGGSRVSCKKRYCLEVHKPSSLGQRRPTREPVRFVRSRTLSHDEPVTPSGRKGTVKLRFYGQNLYPGSVTESPSPGDPTQR